MFKMFDTAVAKIVHPIIVVAGLTVTCAMVVGVFTRYVMNAPVFGLEEIILLAVMWFYMLGAAMASRERSHLSADFVKVITNNKAVLRVAAITSTVISLAVSLMIVTWCYDLMAWGFQKGQSTPVFSVPWVVSQASLFVASIFFVVYLVRDLILEIRGDTSSNASEKVDAE